eukprot:14546907-Alexandrium_andersonii.AAC.1
MWRRSLSADRPAQPIADSATPATTARARIPPPPPLHGAKGLAGEARATLKPTRQPLIPKSL